MKTSCVFLLSLSTLLGSVQSAARAIRTKKSHLNIALMQKLLLKIMNCKCDHKHVAVLRSLRGDKLLFITSAHRGDACNHSDAPRGPCLSEEEVGEHNGFELLSLIPVITHTHTHSSGEYSLSSHPLLAQT